MKFFCCAGLTLAALAWAVVPLAAAPRTIADCEKIQATDAYNQCLASFGPVAHLKPMKPLSGGAHSGGTDSGGDESDGDDERPSHYHYRHGHHGSVIGHRHGRHFVVLSGGGHRHHRR